MATAKGIRKPLDGVWIDTFTCFWALKFMKKDRLSRNLVNLAPEGSITNWPLLPYNYSFHLIFSEVCLLSNMKQLCAVPERRMASPVTGPTPRATSMYMRHMIIEIQGGGGQVRYQMAPGLSSWIWSKASENMLLFNI
jgi:hypothetical protein